MLLGGGTGMQSCSHLGIAAGNAGITFRSPCLESLLRKARKSYDLGCLEILMASGESPIEACEHCEVMSRWAGTGTCIDGRFEPSRVVFIHELRGFVGGASGCSASVVQLLHAVMRSA